MVAYDRTKYLERRPDGTLSDATQALRNILNCQIGDCVTETTRLNSAKCEEHLGLCTAPGCESPSWMIRDGRRRDARYCPFHTGRARNGTDLMAPRGKARTVISREDDPVNLERWDGVWRISPSGYWVRHVRTMKGRTLTQQQHRVFMEEHLGRYLERHENVHHRNGWTLDNRISNLELWDRAQTPGQRVADKLEWCFEYLGERGLVTVSSEIIAESNVGWVAYPPRKTLADIVGRALYDHEIASVLDRDRKNLTPENLELWTRSCPVSYEEADIVSWMREFLPQYGYRVVD